MAAVTNSLQPWQSMGESCKWQKEGRTRVSENETESVCGQRGSAAPQQAGPNAGLAGRPPAAAGRPGEGCDTTSKPLLARCWL